MQVSRFIALAFTGTALLTACADQEITSIDAGHADFKAAPAAVQVADVAGTWHWSTTEKVAFPPFLAGLLGVAPEGSGGPSCLSNGRGRYRPRPGKRDGPVRVGPGERGRAACPWRGAVMRAAATTATAQRPDHLRDRIIAPRTAASPSRPG